MTKKELIKSLENYDDDMPVVMFTTSPYCQYKELYVSGSITLEAKDNHPGDYYDTTQGTIKVIVLSFV